MGHSRVRGWMMLLVAGAIVFSGVVSADAESELSVTLPPYATEGAGQLAGAGSVTASEPPVSDVIVDLYSNDPSKVIVPAGVTIPAGQSSAAFDLTIIDDLIIDKITAVTVTASAPQWSAGKDTILVADNDSIDISHAVACGYYHTLALENDGSVWSWGADGNTPAPVPGITEIIAVAAGFKHSMALQADGNVWAWGDNHFGQLGEGTTTDSSSPVPVSGLSGVIEIAAGYFHSIALKSDGSVWAWGSNTYGQLGDGTTIHRSIPVQVSNLTDVVSIVAGHYHNLALKADGSVWVWGANFYGQLGEGTTTDSNTPVQVPGLSGVTEIAAGSGHSLAIKSDGSVWAWGSNYEGQIGEATPTTISMPVPVSPLSGMVSIAAGYCHSLALKSDGSVWTWGYNIYGQLGSGTTESSSTPLQVPSIEDVIATFGGFNRTLAVKADGTIWAWGRNDSGQLGDGTTENRFSPVQVIGFGGAGFFNLKTLAVSIPADVVESGGVLENQGLVSIDEPLADDLLVELSADDSSAVLVPATVIILAGQTFSAFDLTLVDDDLLDGTQTVTVAASAPDFSEGTDTIRVHDDETATLSVVLPEGAREGDGVLAEQGAVNVNTPVDSDVVISLISNDTSEITVPETVTIAAGQTSTLFNLTIIDDTEIDDTRTATVTASVTGWSSGSGTMNISDNEIKELSIELPESVSERAGLMSDAGSVIIPGTLTYGLTVNLSSDNLVKAAVPVTATIPAGQTRATFDLTIFDNASIDGDFSVTITASIPDWTAGSDKLQVLDNDGVIPTPAIAAGGSHSLVLKDDMTVWAWGDNYSGQLGDGTTVDSSLPVKVSILTGVISIAAGYFHSLALKADGSVWAWGENYRGQLGDGTTTNSSIPVQVYGLSDIIGVAAGEYHSLALKADGSVWAWGENYRGQLGDGTTTNSSTPVQVANLSGVASLSAGYYHSLALKADGSVWAWGYNSYGQLGDGTKINSNTPVQVSGLSDVIGVAAGYYHSLAIKSDGSVWAWGSNYQGQIGEETTTTFSTPVQVSSLSGMVSIAAGYYHSLALKSDGSVWTWGYNSYGQLGDGTEINSSTPVQVANLSGVASLSAGYYHSLALKADGSVWAWGYNSYGQLGDGSVANSLVPSPVSDSAGTKPLDIIGLAVVLPQFATEGDGILIGQGTVSVNNAPTSSLVINLVSEDPSEIIAPVTVFIPAGQTSAAFDIEMVDDALLDGSQIVRITASATGYYPAAGEMSVYDNEVASLTVELPLGAVEGVGLLDDQGTVIVDLPVDNDVVVSLTSTDTSEIMVPETVTIPTGQTSASFNLTIIDDTEIDGTQLTTITASVPGWTPGSNTIVVDDDETKNLTVLIPERVTELAGVLVNGGTVSIGGTYASDLDINLTSDDVSVVALPAAVTIPAGKTSAAFDISIIDHYEIDGDRLVTVAAAAENWIPGVASVLVIDVAGENWSAALAAGKDHTIVLNSAGTILAWGQNYYSQLGDGTQENRSTPLPVSGITAVRAIAAGGLHSLALTVDGTLWAWGYNDGGQLGDGTYQQKSVPAQVVGLSDVIAVAAGYWHSLALKVDGTLWSWGENSDGQLGDGTYQQKSVPAQVAGLSDVVAVAAGYWHSLALKSDGSIWAWGDNYYGQLGDGTQTRRPSPVKIEGVADIVSLDGGLTFSLALKADGTVWAWGFNNWGQLGDNTTENHASPVKVKNLRDVIAVAAGDSHILALKRDGSVWTWGYNYYGQLGDGTNQNSFTPVQVTSLAGVVAVAAGGSYSLALKSDGSLWAWGYNYCGQLGDGTNISTNSPVQARGAGESEFLDLTSLQIVLPENVAEDAGRLTGAGIIRLDSLSAGDLQVSLTSSDTSLVSVPNVVTIPAGQTTAAFDLEIYDDTLLTGSRGAVITATATRHAPSRDWILVSDNETAVVTVEIPPTASETSGVLSGQGTVSVSLPVDVDVSISLSSEDASEVIVPSEVTILAHQTSAVFDLEIVDDDEIDGTKQVAVTAVFDNWPLGTDVIDVEDTENRVITLQVPAKASERDGLLAAAGSISLSGWFASDLVVNLTSDDPTEAQVPASVTIVSGQTMATFDLKVMHDAIVDDTQTITITASAEGWNPNSALISIHDVDGLDLIPSTSGGGYHSIALKDDGTVWVWGNNDDGQLGDGTTNSRSLPVRVAKLSEVVAVSNGVFHSLSLKSDGTVWAWGWNEYGQLGDGTTESRFVPVQVANLGDAVALAAGEVHSLALKSDGTVWAWGDNFFGQLGDGTDQNRLVAVLVTDLVDVVAVAGGYYHSLALKSDGTVWAWGCNSNSELGIGTQAFRSPPGQVLNLNDVIAVAAGDDFSLALKSDGTVWAWGYNYSGQLGDSTVETRSTPVQVENLTDVVAIAAGYLHSLALKSDGTVWAWGNNYYGQLGDGTLTSRSSAVQVHNLSHVIGLAVGNGYSLAVKSDGSVWGWGENEDGQLGMGYAYSYKTTPVQVKEASGLGYLDLISLSLNIPDSANEGDGINGLLSVDIAPTSDLVVDLTTSDSSEVFVPDTVAIPAGQTSVNFDFAIMDNDLLDGDRGVKITASASGYYPSNKDIQIIDDETAVLTVVVPAVVAEGKGVLANQGLITVDRAVNSDFTVLISSDDTHEVTVPESVTIHAGQASTLFNLEIIDDAIIDGSKIVTISASVDGWASGSATIEVRDDETDPTIIVPFDAVEGQGILTDAGIVTIPSALSEDLLVELMSDDPTEVDVPEFVTISTGEKSVRFDLTIVDDAEKDGAQTVVIAASAAGWPAVSDTVVVRDNETSVLQFSAGSYHVNENADRFEISVNRTLIYSGAASIDYTTSDGNAIAGVDYTASSGTLTFENGETTKKISISLLDNDQEDGDKYLNVTLDNPGGDASLGNLIDAVIYIFDDENPTGSDSEPPLLVSAVPADGSPCRESIRLSSHYPIRTA